MNSKITVTFALLLVIALGLVLRFEHLGSYSLDGDEPSSIMAATGLRSHEHNKTFPSLTWLEGNMETKEPYFTQQHFLKHRNKLSSVIKACIQEDSGNGIAYNLLLNCWIRLVGTQDILVKMLSVLFGVLCIPLTYLCAREIIRPTFFGVLAALVVAIHPGLIYYSQTVRSYSMGVFVGLVSTYFFLRLLRGDKSISTAIFHCLASSTALLTHYFTCYLLASQVVAACVLMRKKKTLKLFAASFACCLLALAIWMMLGGLQGQEIMSAQNQRLANLMRQHAPGYSDWVKPITPSTVAVGVWHQLGLLSGVVFNPAPQGQFWRSPVFAYLLLVSSGLVTSVKCAMSQETRINLFVLMVLTFAAPAFTFVLALKAGHTVPFDIRYLSFAVPYFAIIVGFVVAQLATATGSPTRKWCRRILSLAIILSVIPVTALGNQQLDAMTFQPNRYLVASRLIKLQYQPEQIVCFPTWASAAYTNMFLDDCTKPIAQRVDINEKEVTLQDSHGNKIRTLMDLAANKTNW